MRLSGDGVVDFAGQRSSITMHAPTGENLEERLLGNTAYVKLPPRLVAADPRLHVASNIVRDIAGQLIANGGRVTNSHRAALGISAAALVDPSGNPQGVGVQSVRQGGPAERAGIQAGDVIISVAGQQVPDPATLSTVLATLTVGQTVPVVLQRGGTSRTVQVTLGDLGS